MNVLDGFCTPGLIKAMNQFAESAKVTAKVTEKALDKFTDRLRDAMNGKNKKLLTAMQALEKEEKAMADHDRSLVDNVQQAKWDLMVKVSKMSLRKQAVIAQKLKNAKVAGELARQQQ